MDGGYWKSPGIQIFERPGGYIVLTSWGARWYYDNEVEHVACTSDAQQVESDSCLPR